MAKNVANFLSFGFEFQWCGCFVLRVGAAEHGNASEGDGEFVEHGGILETGLRSSKEVCRGGWFAPE